MENLTLDSEGWELITRKNYYVGVKKQATGEVVSGDDPCVEQMSSEVQGFIEQQKKKKEKVKLPYGVDVFQQVGQTVQFDALDYPQLKPVEWRKSVMAYRRNKGEKYFATQEGTSIKVTRLA